MRNVKDWYIFIDALVVNKKKLYMYLEGRFYTPDDALLTGIKAILAEEHSRELSKKINSAHRKRQKEGKGMCKETSKYGIKLAVLPLSVLEEVKAYFQRFAAENQLNEYQKWIVNQRYVFALPAANFSPQAIVVAVWKSTKEEAIANPKIDRNLGGNSDVRRIFANEGFALKYEHWWPQKHMAVRAGLCEYGRNSIAYCADWGSFIRIGTYVTDAPFDNYTWRDVVSMDACAACSKCIENCPTKAISPDKFLINPEICLPGMKTDDGSHNECYVCQDICPANAVWL